MTDKIGHILLIKFYFNLRNGKNKQKYYYERIYHTQLDIILNE